jgi:uncharacterized protein
MYATYVLLGLAILGIWLAPLRVGARTLAPWVLAFAAALASGLASGVLSWPALFPLGALAGLAALEGRFRAHGDAVLAGTDRARRARWLRGLARACAGLIALALALHTLPGFHNPSLVADLRLSPDAAPMTQYLNFDKGAAGLFLLLYCPRSACPADVRRWAPITLGAAALTTTLVVGLALTLGYVRFDPKLPPIAGWMLATNLLFTCAVEEAFFRGLIQAPLARVLPGLRFSAVLAVAVSTALFVLAHAPRDAPWAALVALTGLGSASVFALSGRIEPAILVHFSVNAVHLLLFTYPRLP